MSGQHNLLHGYAPITVADLLARAHTRTVAWTPAEDDLVLNGLDREQAAGLACVACGVSYLTHQVEHVAVGRSTTDSLVYACTHCPTTTAVTTRQPRP